MTMLPLTIVEADYNKMVKLIIARKKNDMAIAECPAPRSNVPLFLQPAATLAQISINDLRDIRRVLSLQAEYAKQSNSFDQTGVPMLDAINADLAQINAALAIKQKAESLTQEQAEKLADRIIKNIYRTDYKTNIEWLVLESIKDNPAILNAAVLEKIKKKYQVFNSTDDIPEKFRGYGPNNKYDGYNRGIIFKYKITFNSTDTVTVDFEMYIAPLNAGGWDWQYKWNGKEWIDNPRDASTIKMWAA